MSNQSEPISSKDTASLTASKAKIARRRNEPNVEFGKLKFRLPLHLERAIRFAAFELEVNPKAIHTTPEALVIEGVRRYMESLTKHITFPVGMWPNDKADSESAT